MYRLTPFWVLLSDLLAIYFVVQPWRVAYRLHRQLGDGVTFGAIVRSSLPLLALLILFVLGIATELLRRRWRILILPAVVINAGMFLATALLLLFPVLRVPSAVRDEHWYFAAILCATAALVGIVSASCYVSALRHGEGIAEN